MSLNSPVLAAAAAAAASEPAAPSMAETPVNGAAPSARLRDDGSSVAGGVAAPVEGVPPVVGSLPPAADHPSAVVVSTVPPSSQSVHIDTDRAAGAPVDALGVASVTIGGGVDRHDLSAAGSAPTPTTATAVPATAPSPNRSRLDTGTQSDSDSDSGDAPSDGSASGSASVGVTTTRDESAFVSNATVAALLEPPPPLLPPASPIITHIRAPHDSGSDSGAGRAMTATAAVPASLSLPPPGDGTTTATVTAAAVSPSREPSSSSTASFLRADSLLPAASMSFAAYRGSFMEQTELFSRAVRADSLVRS